MTKEKRSFIDILWDFFASLKLTIVLLILLAATSIIGTLIQQNRSPQEYQQFYGETLHRLFEMLNFYDMYHSWWFLALLGIFALNLTTCSLKRLPRVWKQAFEPVTVADDAHYKSLSNRHELRVPQTPEAARDRLVPFLGEVLAAPVVTEADGRIHLYAEKHPWSRFGVYVTHLSILIIFIGAIIGNLWGFKAFVNIEEGTMTSKVWTSGGREPIDLGFSVRCDDFEVTYYDGTNRPKEFMSILDIVDNGQEVISDRKIIVNDPLSYKGITLYQSSYGPAGNPQLKIRVTDKASGEVQEITVAEGRHYPLAGGHSFAVTGYTDNYGQFGPAVEMHINTPDGRHGAPFVVVKNFPNFGGPKDSPFSFALLDYQQKQYTGLQVKKDPGVWVVWLGCALLVLGSIAAFTLSHRRLWARIEPDGKGAKILLGGNAHRNQPAFALFFDELKQQADDAFKTDTSR